VDGTPVILFYGGTPPWRPLYAGVTPGRDVAQLNRNLIALGYGAGLGDSDCFTGATVYAVDRWQAARGLPVTGTVPLGEVAYAPGPLRVTGVTPALGAVPQPGGPLLTATSMVPVVTAAVPVGQEYLLRAGEPVTVTLPDGTTTTPGVIASVSTVATAASAGDSTAGPGPGPGGSFGGSEATVAVTVRLIHPGAAGHLDQAPVNVSIVTAQARGVLAVPISALVALAGGGYAVEVVHGSVRTLTAVRTGLFSATLIQVSGAGLGVGTNVEVPSP
jgi:Putative peptidoglycan binding domain